MNKIILKKTFEELKKNNKIKIFKFNREICDILNGEILFCDLVSRYVNIKYKSYFIRFNISIFNIIWDNIFSNIFYDLKKNFIVSKNAKI